MTKLILIFAALNLALPIWAIPRSGLTTAREIKEATYDNVPTNQSFNLVATVAYPLIRTTLIVLDNGISTQIHVPEEDVQKTAQTLKPGDKIRISGNVVHNPHNGNNYAFASKIDTIEHTSPPIPEFVTPKEISSIAFRDRVVTLSGFIADVFRDEIDPRFIFFILSDGSSSAYLTLFGHPDDTVPSHLIGADVEVVGIVNIPRKNTTNRKNQHVTLTIKELDSIKIRTPAPADPFDVPALHNDNPYTQNHLNPGLKRRRISGIVLAVWRDKALLRTKDGTISQIHFSSAEYPKCGETIMAAGIPDTDLFRLNLSRAIWRKAQNQDRPIEQPPEIVNAETLLTDGMGNTKISAAHYGKLVRISGILAAKPSIRLKNMRAELACGDMRIAVDLTSAPYALEETDLGSSIDVTGICVIEAEVLRPQTPYPHIQDIFLAIRSPADIHVTAHPPWWTTGRLLAVVGALLAALVAITVWNRTLERLARRRGRQLMREQIEREKALLKTDERTRLAVELHDSVAQNLSGVSMQIDAAVRNYGSDEKKMLGNLYLASTILKSSREELRNCLWDLRNHALDEKNMNAAIRQTLKPVVDESLVSVDFRIPRHRLSENTAHAVLRIIRELVSNSINHGHATKIDISGEELESGIRFSVSDNGTGFDTSSIPGPAQGHFGLTGIKERLRDFSGTFEVKSTPGKGTLTTITIP